MLTHSLRHACKPAIILSPCTVACDWGCRWASSRACTCWLASGPSERARAETGLREEKQHSVRFNARSQSSTKHCAHIIVCSKPTIHIGVSCSLFGVWSLWVEVDRYSFTWQRSTRSRSCQNRYFMVDEYVTSFHHLQKVSGQRKKHSIRCNKISMHVKLAILCFREAALRHTGALS